MGMEVEVAVGVARAHLTEIADGRERVEHAQRVGQHEAAHAVVLEGIDQGEDILLVVAYAVAPVFQIDVDGHTLRCGVAYLAEDVGDVLFGRLAQL